MIGINRIGGMSPVPGVPQWVAGWEHNTAGTNRFRRFLKHLDDAGCDSGGWSCARPGIGL